MNITTGIHMIDQTMRLVTLKRQGNIYSLIALHEIDMPQPVCPETMQTDNRVAFSVFFQHLLTSMTHPLGHLNIVLTGGMFHMQKVPLEMAAAEDRKEQIFWEATQALIPPVENYEIDFWPAGRVAFWTAFRQQTAQTMTDLFAPSNPDQISLIVEPLSLFAACHLTHVAHAGRHTVIHLDPHWLSCVVTENGVLVSAEITGIDSPFPYAQQSLMHQVRLLLQGEITSEKKGISLGQTLFCGTPDAVKTACQQFAQTIVPSPVEMQTFAHMKMPTLSNKKYFETPGAFAVAAGAAYWHLHQHTKNS